MVRTAFVALACSMLSAASALEVITPSEDLVVVSDRTYTVEWTGADSGRFEIDLFYCGSMCMEDSCGDWVTALCPYGEEGCPDNEGDYDIVMPEPMMGTSGSGYKVRVVDVSNEGDSDCSDGFYLLASSEAPTVGDAGYSLTVTSPAEGDRANAGEEYTVEFDYDNGVGSAVDRFDIDLYTTAGTGDCGTFVTTLCDKESIGCKDSMGDYDVEIPEHTPAGEYSIRVGRFEDKDLFDCSGAFTIEGSDDSKDSDSDDSQDGDSNDSEDSDDMSLSYHF